MSGRCPNHGPYDGNTCPYPPPHGDEGRPVHPAPLGDEAATTDIGDRRGRYDNSGEAPTEMPGGKQGRGFLDAGEDETDYGGGKYDSLDETELEAPNVVTLAMLWVKEGRRRGRTYPVKHGTVVGRKEGDLILDDPKVSSLHAKFNMEGDNFVVWDFGSANGTFVNDKRIREATVLEENDLVRIGETVFVVKLLDPRLMKKPSGSAPRQQKPTSKKQTPVKKTKK